jgi:hypothetical protein
MHGRELLEHHKDVEKDEKKQNVFSRLVGAFGEGAEEGGDTATYMEEARHGHVILNVYAGNADEAEKISAILAKFHARKIKYDGNWSIANYPTPND